MKIKSLTEAQNNYLELMDKINIISDLYRMTVEPKYDHAILKYNITAWRDGLEFCVRLTENGFVFEKIIEYEPEFYNNKYESIKKAKRLIRRLNDVFEDWKETK